MYRKTRKRHLEQFRLFRMSFPKPACRIVSTVYIKWDIFYLLYFLRTLSMDLNLKLLAINNGTNYSLLLVDLWIQFRQNFYLQWFHLWHHCSICLLNLQVSSIDESHCKIVWVYLLFLKENYLRHQKQWFGNELVPEFRNNSSPTILQASYWNLLQEHYVLEIPSTQSSL